VGVDFSSTTVSLRFDDRPGSGGFGLGRSKTAEAEPWYVWQWRGGVETKGDDGRAQSLSRKHHWPGDNCWDAVALQACPTTGA
jgi:hypothetical protein